MDSRILMDFDIIRYVSIFLTYFGHNLGTVLCLEGGLRFAEIADPIPSGKEP